MQDIPSMTVWWPSPKYASHPCQHVMMHSMHMSQMLKSLGFPSYSAFLRPWQFACKNINNVYWLTTWRKKITNHFLFSKRWQKSAQKVVVLRLNYCSDNLAYLDAAELTMTYKAKYSSPEHEAVQLQVVYSSWLQSAWRKSLWVALSITMSDAQLDAIKRQTFFFHKLLHTKHVIRDLLPWHHLP